MGNILIIDDDEGMCRMLVRMTERMGHVSEATQSLLDGVTRAQSGRFDVVFLDVRMPDGNGLERLPDILAGSTPPEVIIMTGEGEPDGAELAIKSGAWDYVEKSASLDAMRLPMVRALQYRKEKLNKPNYINLNRSGIIGSSPKMLECLNVLSQAAGTSFNVLIHGETGTGKELFARAIHDNSDRASGPFITVDCASLTETLVESLLFGHKRGAFTGADKDRVGLVTQADGGTLFLDEVGEMPLSLQKAFLRVLQEKRYRPVGGKTEISSDFRLLAATNRDLDAMSEGQQFRSDLLFRIRAIKVEIPPLRERLNDIKELVLYYVSRFCEKNGLPIKAVAPEVVETMRKYQWPGNVRELINAVEWALAVSGDESTLYTKHLPENIRVSAARSKFVGGEDESMVPLQERPTFPKLKDLRRDAIAALERNYIRNLMEYVQHDIQKACRVSGLSRSRIYDLLKAFPVSK